MEPLRKVLGRIVDRGRNHPRLTVLSMDCGRLFAHLNFFAKQKHILTQLLSGHVFINERFCVKYKVFGMDLESQRLVLLQVRISWLYRFVWSWSEVFNDRKGNVLYIIRKLVTVSC